MEGRQILLPYPVKARSASIITMVGSSRDPDKVKAVTVYPRDLFPTDACTYTTWTFPGVALLVTSVRFGKSAHTHLNLTATSSSKRMTLVLNGDRGFKLCSGPF